MLEVTLLLSSWIDDHKAIELAGDMVHHSVASISQRLRCTLDVRSGVSESLLYRTDETVQ